MKMLEGAVEIPKPLNPFQQMIDVTFTGHSVQESGTNASTSNSSSCAIVSESDLNILHATRMTRNDDIELASMNGDDLGDYLTNVFHCLQNL